MEEANQAYEQALDEAKAALQEIHDHKKPSPAMKEMLNNLVNELLQATAEPVRPERYKDPFIYYKPSEGTGGVPAAICTCGWRKPHYRFKVLKKAAIKHFEKTGHQLA